MAFVLTMVISAVNGRPPFATHQVTLADLDVRHLDVQLTSVYFRTATPEVVTVEYRTYSPLFGPNSGNHATQLTIRLPVDSEPKILINNLKNESSCFSSGFDDMKDGAHMMVTKPDDYTYVIVPEVPVTGQVWEKDYFEISCEVTPIIERETFTSKRASFGSDDLTWEPTLSKKYALEGYTSVPSLFVDVGGVEDAEDIQWEGYQDPKLLMGHGTTHVVPSGGIAVAHWKDIGREQTRDIILVIIGTLIAIGATTLIEALRPLIETVAESRKPPEIKHKPAKTH